MRRLGCSIVIICVLLAIGGCAQKANLSMKFNPSDKSTYKIVTESSMDYKFEQPSAKKTKTEQTLTRTEITYDQQIQSVDPCGNAKALITFKEVKYLAKKPQGTTLDFDSSRESDKNNALTNLVNQSYVITISPMGEVIAVGDVQKALSEVQGDSKQQKIAQSLLATDMIKRRHTVALPGNKEPLAVGKSWNTIDAGPAGMLMPKSFEKIYTLKDIKNENGQKVAVVTMEAIPSSVKAAETPKQAAQGMGMFAKMFETADTYTGKMQVNLSTGTVNSYSEKLKSDSVAIDPENKVNPDVLTMDFTHFYSIEKIK